MADYPRDLRIHIESAPIIIDRALMTELRGGGVKMRRLFTNPRYSFRVVHHGLSQAQVAALLNFLTVNRSSVFNLYFPKPTKPTTYFVYQVIWLDSEIEFVDEGNRLSGCIVNMRAAA